MTAQMPEILYYQGQRVSMCTHPLTDYFVAIGEFPEFKSPSTALWRGYVGTWEIKGERLYLIGLDARVNGETKVNLATYFPDFPDRVFAHWFTGEIRIPMGKLLEYVHMGYASTYEEDHFLTLNAGVVENVTIRENGTSDDAHAPAGYIVGAAYQFGARE